MKWKKIVKKTVKWIKGHYMTLIVLAMSIILFFLLKKFIGMKKAIILVGGLDFLYLLPGIYRLVTHKKKKKKTKQEKKLFYKRIGIGIFSLGIMGLLTICVFFFMIVKKAPDFDPDRLYKKESSILYDANGNIYAKLGAEKRENITYEEMPEVLVDAIIATEDSRFFQHNGFDLPRFLVASMKQLLGNSSAGGASTLTMQINKNNYTSTTSTGWSGIVRKFTDIYMAIFKIEKQYTKKEILEFYANSNYLGSGAYGVEQASLTYFGKSAKDMNLAEAALVAGLFNAPNYLDPYVYPERAESRRQTVLYLMERHGYITSEEREIAKELTVDKLLVKRTGTANAYQSFINQVTSEVLKNTGNNPYDVPMEIYTTMDAEKQQYLDDIFNGNSSYVWENDVVQAGTVILDVNTGAIVAISGGRNRNNAFGYSFATDITRQIGSTAKPLYDYGPGIEYQNWSTYTPFTDEPHAYSDGTTISNWNRTYEGFKTMRDALTVSRNIPALKAFQANKNSDIKTFVTNLGLSPELQNGKVHEAHALGGYNAESPLTMAAAYAAFGNGGYYNQPYSVSKIVYRETNETWEYKAKKVKAMSEETAYMVANMLIDSGKYGLSRYSNINGAEYGAKSGTSNYTNETIKLHNYPSNAVNDLWVSGTNAQYAISLWYGYEEALDGYTSTTNTMKHRELFQKIAQGFWKKGVTFKKPSNVIEVEIETETYPAQLASEGTPEEKKITELFKKGTEPTEVSKRFSAPDAPTSLTGSYSNSKMELTWQAVATPYGLDRANAEALGKALFGDATERNNFITSYMSYNEQVLGELVYKIYEKSSNGNLTLIGTTKETKFEFRISSTSSPLTYVVKAGYTNSSVESIGAEFTYQFGDNDSIITASLKGEKDLTLEVGDTFQDLSVSVFENLIDVTSSATITTKIERKSDGKEVSIILTDTPDSYTITYQIRYKDYTETLKRNVVIKEIDSES